MMPISGAVRLYIATMTEQERTELRRRTAAARQSEKDRMQRLKSDIFMSMCEDIWKSSKALDSSAEV